MFAVKKAIASLLMPFPLFLILILIGLFFWYRRDDRKAKAFILFAFVWISLLSYSPFSSLLLSPLEKRYTYNETDFQQGDYIHVLGGGHVSNPNLPLSSQIALISLARVIEGVNIYKKHPHMKLIFSGYGGNDPISNAKKNSELAISLGVSPSAIIILESPKDTADEAIAAKQIVGQHPLILVTSASHMERASRLFRQNGLNVIEAPTDFQVKNEPTLWQLPCSEGLSRSEAAFHEYLGLLWGKIRGLL
jgi:uncharacterized SAM-binding protein YcdF (DUF218 family)